jgi:PKD repeat protein
MRVKTVSIAFALLAAVMMGTASAGEIDPGLAIILEATPADQQVSVLVFLNDRVDLKAIEDELNWQGADLRQRHETVVRALQVKATDTQDPMQIHLKGLEDAGVISSFDVFWIVNAFEVTTTKEYIELIAARPDVARVYYNYEVETIQPVDISAADPGAGAAVEPGIDAVRAPEAWALGITGEGVLVANIDTGVEGDHPALASRWAGVADPRYDGHPEWAWYDPYLGINDFPYDNHGHGTHTMGSICGGVPGDEVGVAPGAYWIAAGAVDRGGGIARTVADIILSFQWMADPDGNPGTDWDVPDVMSNSWGVTTSHGYPPCDELFWGYIDACEAAGTVVFFSAGNEGTSGLRRPADRATDDYRNCAVAAVDANTAGWPIAWFSSRGPTYCTPGGTAAIKPDIAGPGVSVRSSYPGHSYTYMSGTSMSCPHVTGVAALIRDANPNLTPDEVKQIIYETAYDLGTPGEDNDYGWGMVDAYEAVMLAMVPDTLPPVADFVGNPTSGYVPLGVQFTDLSTNNPTSWYWDFGDGIGTSTEKNPYYTYNDTGSFTVSLTATNDYGSDTEIKTDYITVTEAPVFNIHVADIVVDRFWSSKKHMTGRATVTIVDQDNFPVEDATVYGFFNDPDSKTKTGITDYNGVAVITSTKTKTPPSDWCFEVTDVVKAGETYDPTENVVTKACESGPVYRIFSGTIPLPEASDWKITIYNIVGRKVEQFSGSGGPGPISVIWDGSDEASGVYLYRVEAGDNRAIEKMVLLK